MLGLGLLGSESLIRIVFILRCSLLYRCLHMIDLGGDVCGNGISKLVFTILSAVAENERDRIRERIRDVKLLASQGVYGGGKRPFGFDVVNHRLVPQAAIARMQALRANGRPLREISRVIASEFHVEMPATSIKRILNRAAAA
jgi:putative DNA-invertase from lambdoid prophage Rac